MTSMADRGPEEKYLPLTESTTHILLALTGPLHGYGVMQKVREMSDGLVEIGAGTLYGALSTLQNEGLIHKVHEETFHLLDGGEVTVPMRRSSENTEWVLTSLNGESLIEGTEINPYFEAAFLGGSMTCNGYRGGPDSGNYVATDDGALTLAQPIAVTAQLCSEP
jgi:DNA-binding PadR family transcriptional regulator